MAAYTKYFNSQDMDGDALETTLEQILQSERVPPPQKRDGTPPCSQEAEVPLTGRLIDQVTDQQPPTQSGLPTPPLSPNSTTLPLAADRPVKEVLEKERKERQRLIFLRNAIELRRRHYARVAGAQKIAAYILQCYSWGYPIDWMTWANAIPRPQMDFSKRDPSTYRKPQAAGPGLGASAPKAQSTGVSFISLEDGIIIRVMGMLDFPMVHSLRLTSKRFNDVYKKHMEDICGTICENGRRKISYIPDLRTPIDLPEHSSEEKLRQHHYCIDWIVQSILPDYHAAKAILDDTSVQVATNAFLQIALHPPRRKGNGRDVSGAKRNGKGIPIRGNDVGYQSAGVGNAERSATPSAEVIQIAEDNRGAFNIYEKSTGSGQGGQKQSGGKQRSETPSISGSARPQIMEGETFPFIGLLKYVFEKHLGSPRRSKDNLLRYHKGLNKIEQTGLRDGTRDRKAFHWAMNLVLWYLRKERTIYYGIRNEFLNQIKEEYEEDDEEENEEEFMISDREYVERLKWLRPAQLWELVRLVDVKPKDVMALVKARRVVEAVEEDVDEAEVVEEFILGRIKQILQTQ
ncbi:hypothetical protein TWF506_004110 [Arthrobotrys conoides]|uniref:F-box domain-containing protein n=1 Tax=Arthrobotrys conoides TaxID=74498 RepID=A0AAN8RTT0_9PEZI